jgi:hypothetical protein
MLKHWKLNITEYPRFYYDDQVIWCVYCKDSKGKQSGDVGLMEYQGNKLVQWACADAYEQQLIDLGVERYYPKCLNS